MKREEILTLKEVCTLLQTHPSTLYKLTKRGRIPAFRIGQEWRFRRDAIKQWMAEKTIFSLQIHKVVMHSARNVASISENERQAWPSALPGARVAAGAIHRLLLH